MVKFMLMFHKPGDLAQFEDTYNKFLAQIEQIPDITRRQVISILGSPQGTPNIYRILEVYFSDYDALTAALRSPAGQAAGGTLNQFPKGTVDMLFAEVYEEVGGFTPTE